MSEARPAGGSRQRALGKKEASGTQQDSKRGRGLWAWLLETYATADPRSLGVFRILLGLVLIHDVARRWPDLVDHYTNSGWLTNHFAMFRPMSSDLFSLYLAFSTLAEVRVLVLFQLLVNCLLLVGYRTKLMQILAFVLIVSLNSRNIMLENGGFVVVHLLCLWSMFLPLGRRYSVDALLLSMRERREASPASLNALAEPSDRTRPVVSLAVTALILQFAIIYYFNVVHKTGNAWRDGSAVYYFFQQDRMVTLFGAWARQHVPIEVVRLLTWSTLVTESLIALFLVSPVQTKKLRMVGWGLVFGLHASIDAVVQLGPFSYAMFVVHSIFIPREFWRFMAKRRARKHGVVLCYLEMNSGFGLWCGRVLKRLLPRGSTHFVALEPAKSYSGPDGDFEKPVRFAELDRQLVVTDERGEERWVGAAALVRLSRGSLPLGVVTAGLRIGFVAAMVDGWLARAFESRTRLSRALGLDTSAREVQLQAKSPREKWLAALASGLQNAILLFFVVCCTSQVLVENQAIPSWLKPASRPTWMTAGVVYPRLFQGWSMFAPNPPMDDGKVVVEGRTKDGRHFDPLTQKEPDYELNPERGFEMNQLWGDFHRRIWLPRFRVYWNGFRDYLKNHHQITGKPEDELVGFEVYYVSEAVPPPGVERPEPRKERLFTWGSMAKSRRVRSH